MASEIRVNTINNRSGLGTVNFTDSGVIVSGVATANSFSGDLTGNVTGNLTGNVTGNVTSSSTSTFSNGLNVTGGSVGIGTDNPNYKLNIHDASIPRIQLTNDTTGTTTSDGFLIYVNGSDTFLVNRESGTIDFATNNTTRARVSSGGNFEIANGNLVFSTAGTGIDFSATANGSGTTDSELFDDYEEGSWTPTYIAASGTITAHSNTAGRYVKIGKSVYIWGYISYSSHSGASGNVTIGGLPFTSGSGYGQATNRSGGAFTIGNYSFLTNTPQFGNIESGTTSIIPISPRSGQDNGFLQLNFSDFDTRPNYSQFVFAGQYLT